MPVTNVHKDADALTMTITATYAVPADRVWQLWDDPRQLERWWGPPTYPATFVQHELAPGATVAYYMTSPEGQRFHGLWRVEETEPPHRLRFQDGFADDDGNPNDAMPTSEITVTIAATGDGATMEIHTQFPSPEAMEQLLAMGMDEGMALALGQIDALLAE